MLLIQLCKKRFFVLRNQSSMPPMIIILCLFFVTTSTHPNKQINWVYIFTRNLSYIGTFLSVSNVVEFQGAGFGKGDYQFWVEAATLAGQASVIFFGTISVNKVLVQKVFKKDR